MAADQARGAGGQVGVVMLLPIAIRALAHGLEGGLVAAIDLGAADVALAVLVDVARVGAWNGARMGAGAHVGIVARVSSG